MTSRINILGVGIDPLNLPSAVAAVGEAIRTRAKGYVCVTGVHGVSEAQEDPAFRAILNRAALNTPDGMPMVWLGRWQGRREMDRVYGPDLLLEVCRASEQANWRHFFYGGAPGVAEQLAAALQSRFPKLTVAGTYTPPFRPLNEQETEELRARVAEKKPDIIWVGLSTPKQEIFMAGILPRLDTTLMIGVGAAFDLLSGRVRQAPRWVQRSGFEWLYRLIQEPGRLWKRYLKNNPLFVWRVFLQLTGLRRYEIGGKPRTMSGPLLSIITPSYRQARWLGLCAASVADQGAEAEHIVQDNLSGPEVAEALAPFPRVKLAVEKDGGMYDAINRGWEKAGGEILAWLNCDEQYLPGTLAAVAGYFHHHPETDILFADAVVTDEGGNYGCSRQVLPPQLGHTWICHLQTFSCATFFRRRLIRERGFWLDPRWRVAGDADLVLRMLRGGARVDVLRRYASTFIDHGGNLGLSPRAVEERDALAGEAPRWMQALRPWWVTQHRLRRLGHGLYWPRPFGYDIYTEANPQKRVHFDVPRPTFYWRTRMK